MEGDHIFSAALISQFPTLFDDIGPSYNDERGGVCLVLAMTDSPFVVTVTTRAVERETAFMADCSVRAS